MNPADKEALIKMLAVGALTGTGAGLIGNLRKHYKLLEQQADESERIRARSVVPASPVEKMAKGLSPFWGGVGIAGGLGLGVLSKNVVDKLYQSVRRKELQRQLADAEEAYAAALLTERDALAQKSASNLRMSELILPLMVASLPVAAIGSGIATNKLLDQHFGPQAATGRVPKLKPDQLPALVAQQELEERERLEKEQRARTKGASWTFDDDIFTHLLGTVCAFTKAADLRNLVRAVALGRGKELEKHAAEFGFDSALDICKGADNHAVDAKQFEVALMRLAKTASMRPCVEILIAAEMCEHMPHQVKLASTLAYKPQADMLELLQKQAQLLRAQAFDFMEDEEDLSKQASDIEGGNIPRKMSDVKLVEYLDGYLEKKAGIFSEKGTGLRPTYDSQSVRPSMESDPDSAGDDPSIFEQPPKDPIDVILQRDGGQGSTEENAGQQLAT